MAPVNGMPINPHAGSLEDGIESRPFQAERGLSRARAD